MMMAVEKQRITTSAKKKKDLRLRLSSTGHKEILTGGRCDAHLQNRSRNNVRQRGNGKRPCDLIGEGGLPMHRFREERNVPSAVVERLPFTLTRGRDRFEESVKHSTARHDDVYISNSSFIHHFKASMPWPCNTAGSGHG
jgi:hypothetical protein